MQSVHSINGVLNAARQGLYASQAAIQVTGQNIANVNTEGYSRQRVILDPSSFGDGVNVRFIQSVRNSFFDGQLAGEREKLGTLSAHQSALAQMELIFDESNGLGLSSSMSEYFSALQDLTVTPDGTAERETVRTKATSMAGVFASVRGRLEQLRKDSDTQVEGYVSKINSIAQQIATLNEQILRQSGGGQPPNELIDQRYRLLTELSEIVDINHFETDGGVTVFMAGGQPLIENGKYSKLEVQTDTSNFGLNSVMMNRFDGQKIDLTDKIKGGLIGGTLEMRDGEIFDQMQKIDKLAAQFVTEFNILHRQGMGLDGITDRDFWEQVSVWTTDGEGNMGGVKQTASAIIDQTQLTFADYEIRFTDVGGGSFTYDIVNTSSGATVSAGNPYVPGAAIVFDGLSVTLDDTFGPPVDGDVICLNTYNGMASQMNLSAAVAGDLTTIAAGTTSSPGDNTNALALAGLESALVLNGGTATFSDVLTGQLTSLGIKSQQVERDLASQELAVDQIQALITSVSGVSLDEESANLIQFERSFQASSRLISVVDELLQTIISMV